MDFQEIFEDVIYDHGEECLHDSVMPGICKICGSVTECVEPDCDDGWCEDHGGPGVRSLLDLLLCGEVTL